MGILDDAIREHLELKRKRGAADDEVARQEAEALGPARRQPASELGDEAAVGEATEALAPEPLEADETLPPPPDPASAADVADAPPPPESFEPLEPLEAAEPLEPLEEDPGDRLPPHGDVEPIDEPTALHEPSTVDEPELDEPLHAEPAEEDPLAPPPDPADVEPIEAEAEVVDPEVVDPGPPAADDQATRARPLPPLEDDDLPPEPALPDREPDESEDVLEETPDFLQDTPEHDRLWFEQKPPRDFDFDD